MRPSNRSESFTANSTQFGATQQTTNNREELRLKMLLTGSYDFIHRETGKMIQRRQFRRAFTLLERFNQSRKDLQIAEVIQLNRRILTCIIKILKSHLIKPDWHSEEVLVNLVKRGSDALFDLYKYLNIFVQKVLPDQQNNIVLEDVSNLSNSIEKDPILQKPPITQKKINTTYDAGLPKFHKKPSTLASHLQQLEDNETVGDRIAEMITRNEKFLNIQFELEQLWGNNIQLLIFSSLIYKKYEKIKVAYFNLIEADRISQQLLDTNNPNLINLRAQVKVHIGNLLFECGHYGRALKFLDQALVILNGELQLRLNDEKFFGRQKINKERSLQKKCIKTYLSAIMSFIMVYESTGQFQLMMDAINTASWVSEKFIIGLDEIKKHIVKLQIMGKNRLEMFFHETSDLSHIAQQALEQEIYTLKKQKLNNQPTSKEQYLQQFHNEMYELFQIKGLNNQQFYIHKSDQPKEQQKENPMVQKLFSDTKNLDSHPQLKINNLDYQHDQQTEMSLNLENTESSDEEQSFFEPSFLAPSSQNYLFHSSGLEKGSFRIKSSSTKKKESSPTTVTNNNKQKLAPAQKSVGLIKIGAERTLDHKSNILTTNAYFKQFISLKQAKEIQKDEVKVNDAIVKYQRALENINFRENPQMMSQSRQDLDVYVGRVVQNQIGDGGFAEYEEMKQYLQAQQKQEEFDKKEFSFGRSMLIQRMREAIKKSVVDQTHQPIVKIEVDTKVRDEAFAINQRLDIEEQVKEFKKKRIEMVVAIKQLKKEEVNFSGQDPDDANFWKNALDRTKKKNLRDLILKYYSQLGLKRFYANLMREQKEEEKLQKQKQKELLNEKEKEKVSKKNEQEPEKEKTHAGEQKQDTQTTQPVKKKVVINVEPQTIKESQKLKQSVEKTSKVPIKKILKYTSAKVVNTDMDDEEMGTKLILKQSKDAGLKLQQMEIMDKCQKKAHQVISMIVDGVEKKMSQEKKLLNKLLFFKKGGKEKNYHDEDERMQKQLLLNNLSALKFTSEMDHLTRSTHLLQIKRELSEKPINIDDFFKDKK